MDKFDPHDPKWAKMNKIQLYCKQALFVLDRDTYICRNNCNSSCSLSKMPLAGGTTELLLRFPRFPIRTNQSRLQHRSTFLPLPLPNR